MSRTLHKLNNMTVKSLGKGRHSDGGGLYLRVAASGGRSWSFMFNRAGQRKELGLGPFPALSLKAAREIAKQHRETIAEGGTPSKAVSEPDEDEPTFGEVVERFLDTKEVEWSNAKHRYQWRQTLGPSYCKPILDKPVADIGLDDVLGVLKPHWSKKPETATRLRGRIERVLTFAKVRGWREGENPAIWRGNLSEILPKPAKLVRGHMAAIHYRDMPEFVAELRAVPSISARALEFLILTGSRPGEVLGAEWNELDFEARVWSLPAGRMKARKPHRVPLSAAALAILEPLSEMRTSDYVFPGIRPGKPLSNMTMTKLLRTMKRTETAHGMRSALRDWAGDETTFPREVVEAALAHAVGNSTEQAYRRSDALEKRRELLEAWSSYLAGDADEKVVPLRRSSDG